MGVDHDTAHFAVNAIRSWWNRMGRSAYGGTGHLVITADAGGSNSPRTRLWKWELQRFANRTGLTITVCHYPPGTSKWNRIEHRLFSYIAMNWRGKPLVSLATVVNLIGATTTASGLRVRSEIDDPFVPSRGEGPTSIEELNLSRHEFARRMELYDPAEKVKWIICFALGKLELQSYLIPPEHAQLKLPAEFWPEEFWQNP